MDFDYTLVTDWPNHKPRQRYLPWINIGVRRLDVKGTIWPLELVDSGAEITIVNREIGEELGFNFKKAKRDIVKGFGGGSVEILIMEAEYIIDDNRGKKSIIYKDWIGFTKNQFSQTHPQQTAIFGTIGLFRNVEVNFRYPVNIHIERLTAKEIR